MSVQLRDCLLGTLDCLGHILPRNRYDSGHACVGDGLMMWACEAGGDQHFFSLAVDIDSFVGLVGKDAVFRLCDYRDELKREVDRSVRRKPVKELDVYKESFAAEFPGAEIVWRDISHLVRGVYSCEIALDLGKVTSDVHIREIAGKDESEVRSLSALRAQEAESCYRAETYPRRGLVHGSFLGQPITMCDSVQGD